MDETDRPPLGPYAYEKIAIKCHELEKGFWKELSDMRVQRPLSFMGTRPLPLSPQPPKLPEHLRSTIWQYAGTLFRVEAVEYPAAPEIEVWLSKLAERVVERVMNTIATMNQSSYDIFHSKQYDGLSWHGLTIEEMRDAAWEGARADKAGVLRERGSDSSQISEPDELGQATIADMPDAGDIVWHRKKLLDEYKAATGEPSSKQIYEASNSGIHKPEFYQWKNGNLPVESRVTKRFEGFLKAKKRPVPRNTTT